jgi:hypothetical protein
MRHPADRVLGVTHLLTYIGATCVFVFVCVCGGGANLDGIPAHLGMRGLIILTSDFLLFLYSQIKEYNKDNHEKNTP